MLKIRLQRVGRKNQPAFRMVVTEHTAAPQGRFLEKLGNFTAANKEETMQIELIRVKHWLSVGAQPSDTVARLLVKKGVKEAEKFVKARVQKPSKVELEAKKRAEEEVAAKAAAKAEEEARKVAAKAEEEAKIAAAKAEDEAKKAAETTSEKTPEEPSESA